MRYKFVDHVADVEFIAYGRGEGELFSNALAALFETMADTGAVARSDGRKVRVTVKEEADTLEELLWYTLQRTLSIVESRRVFAYEVAAIKVGEEGGRFRSDVKIYAKEKMDAHSKLAVKGVSRYGLRISKKDGLAASVVIDV